MVDISALSLPNSTNLQTASIAYQRVAGAITKHVAAVLSTDVVVLDGRGVIVASNIYTLVGQPFDSTNVQHPSEDYWVPLLVNGEVGRVIASQPYHGEHFSSRMLKSIVDLVHQQAKLDWNPNSRELKDTFFYDILRGQLTDEAVLSQQARLVGFDVQLAYDMVVIDAPSYILVRLTQPNQELGDASIRRRAHNIIAVAQQITGSFDHSHAAYIGNGEVVLLRPLLSNPARAKVVSGDTPQAQWAAMTALRRTANLLLERLHSAIDPCISIGLGRHHPGVSGLRRTFEEARSVLATGRRFYIEPAVYSLDTLGMVAFVGLMDDRNKADLAAYVLRPLQAEPELLRTLQAFFSANCSPSATVSHLDIHRNTLSYRLDKIATITSLDPRRFDDAVHLRLALLLATTSELATLPASATRR